MISLGADEYKEEVFAYINKEDSPRPVTYQLNLLRSVGFDHVEILHKTHALRLLERSRVVNHAPVRSSRTTPGRWLNNK